MNTLSMQTDRTGWNPEYASHRPFEIKGTSDHEKWCCGECGGDRFVFGSTLFSAYCLFCTALVESPELCS